jgi:hydroxymethylglutaryl-CoA lyase
LQNEKKAIPLATKIELVERLARTGLKTIEAGSFVSPKWTPQVGSKLWMRCVVTLTYS